MSQATDLIAEVKQSLSRVEKAVKRFEKDVTEVGQFTDLAHLRIAAVHIGELGSSLEAQTANMPDVDAPEPVPAADALQEGLTKPELQDLAAKVGVPVSGTKEEIAERIANPEPEPEQDAGLEHLVQPPAEPEPDAEPPASR